MAAINHRCRSSRWQPLSRRVHVLKASTLNIRFRKSDYILVWRRISSGSAWYPPAGLPPVYLGITMMDPLRSGITLSRNGRETMSQTLVNGRWCCLIGYRCR